MLTLTEHFSECQHTRFSHIDYKTYFTPNIYQPSVFLCSVATTKRANNKQTNTYPDIFIAILISFYDVCVASIVFFYLNPIYHLSMIPINSHFLLLCY